MEVKTRSHDCGVRETGAADCREHATLQDLPNELLEEVFSLLPVEDLVFTVRQVCQRWQDLVDEGRVFRHQVFRPDESCASDEDVITVLRGASTLRRVVLGKRGSNQVLQALCETCKDLQQVDLKGYFPAMPGTKMNIFQRLELANQHKFRLPSFADQLVSLGKCRWLKELNIQDFDVPDGVLSAVAEGCPHLEHLSLVHAWYYPEDMFSFLECRGAGLHFLDFDCCREGVPCLLPLVAQHCRALRKLIAGAHYGPSEDLAPVFTMANLRDLYIEVEGLERHVMAAIYKKGSRLSCLGILCHTDIDDALSGIAQLVNLVLLDLSTSLALTDRGVAHAAQCKTLRELYLNDCERVSEQGFYLCHENLPDLTILQMLDTQVSSEFLSTVPYRHRELNCLVVDGVHLKEAEATSLSHLKTGLTVLVSQ